MPHSIRTITDIALAAATFNATVPTALGNLFERLAREGQQPPVLFIGCADSRLVPNLITATGPGELFTLRNIGNLIPPAGTGDHSVAATLEFALGALKIRDIIVCGHSECGAMQALLAGSIEADAMPSLAAWLENGQPSLNRFAGTIADGNDSDVNRLAQINVIQQLENLQEQPVVAAALAKGEVKLWGWYFDIERAQLYAYDAAAERFVTMDETTAARLGKVD